MRMAFLPGEIYELQGGTRPNLVRQKGQAFLKKFPHSSFVPDVLFYLGNAEETAWNLDYPHPKPTFRDQALAYYTQVLQSPKRKDYAEHLSYALPRLRAGYATGNMLYWCFCD